MNREENLNSVSMKESVREYLLGRLNRRTFLGRLTALGFTAAAAQNLSGLLASSPASAKSRSTMDVPVHSVQGNGGAVLVEQLKRCGVDFIFGNPSSHNGPIFDALLERNDIHFILSLQEGTLTAIADGYGKASGKTPFICVARPGFPNTLTHMYNAFKDNSPMIVLADHVDEAARGRAGNQVTDDLIQASEPFTRWRWESRQPETLTEDLRRAFKFATTFPTGPVFLSVPRDFLAATVDSEVIDLDYFSLSTQIKPDEAQIEEIADLLIQAESPMLHVGDEVHLFDAEGDVVELAELLSAPVVQPAEHLRWGACFPTGHPLYLGLHRPNMRFPGSVDVLLNLGGRIRRSDTFTPVVPRSTRLIQVSLDTEDMGRVHPAHYSCPANVKLFTRMLIESIRSKAGKRDIQAWQEGRGRATREFNRKTQESFERVVRDRWSQTPASVERLGMELSEQLGPHTCIVEEMDSGEVIVEQILHFSRDGMRHLSTAGVGLGWSLGASVGAKLALPDHQVLAMLGDGAFMFGGDQALWNMSRYQVPVLTIVLNNRSYDGERTRIWAKNGLQAQQQKDMTCYLGDPDIDFSLLARAYSVSGQQVTSPDDLKAAIRRGLEATRAGEPYLLDVITARRGVGSDSTWYPRYSVAEKMQKG